jgi:hypothetical protein
MATLAEVGRGTDVGETDRDGGHVAMVGALGGERLGSNGACGGD